MALATSVAAAGTAAVGAYLDGRFQIRKDLNHLRRVRTARKTYQSALKKERLCFWYVFEEVVEKFPNNRAIWSRDDGVYTFAEVRNLAIKYAQWFLGQGISPGELVALYLTNCPEFIIIWFGLLCIGCAPAFVNCNLEADSLLHCLNVCETKLLLIDAGEECQERIARSKEQIESKGMKIVTLSNDVKRIISSLPISMPGPEYRRGVNGAFPFCLLYTSGTTGLPKGCAFTTGRLWLLGSHLQPPSFGCKAGVDCWYNAMPLYHGTGSMSCMCQLLAGITIAIGRRFSVSRFWDDIHDSESTFFVYVGEIARYLLESPPHPKERDHKLRCIYGNGLRPDVWDRVQQRFAIAEVVEIFTSTEGLFAVNNWDRGGYQAACVGHHGLILRNYLHNVFIPIKIDYETGDVWRNKETGFGERLPYEQGGEIIVAVPSKQAFQGYWQNETATEKKFCANVFKKGDLYYRSGDALRRDSDGKWYFKDRLGDTFRWKSENVSTAEVAVCLGQCRGVAEANVYGVLVPNHEGRAGCAAICLDPRVDFSPVDLLTNVRRKLPKHAVPVFLRIMKTSSHIHNYKQNKVLLRNEGADPGKTGMEVPNGKDDKILWLNGDRYVDFALKDWKDLEAGQVRL